MTTDAKNAVRAVLAAKGMTQNDLARQLGKHAAAISRTLNSDIVDSRSDWPAILDALGLEIVVQPKRPS